MARKANLWTGFALTDVPPDDETDIMLGGVAPAVAAAPLDLSLDVAAEDPPAPPKGRKAAPSKGDKPAPSKGDATD